VPNEGQFENFAENWLQLQSPLSNWKKRSRSIIYEQISITWWENRKKWSSGSPDN